MSLDRIATLQRAREYAGQGDIERALSECREVLAQFPDDPQAYLCIADFSLKARDLRQAAEGYFRAATLFLQQDAAVNAVSCFREVLKIEPDRADIWAILGDLQAGRGHVNNAVADYLAGAKLHAQRGLLEKALEHYHKILALTPGNHSVRLRMAELYIKGGQIEEAIAEYLTVAEECEANHKEAEAKTLYELILKYVPGHLQASQRVGARDLPLSEATFDPLPFGQLDDGGFPETMVSQDEVLQSLEEEHTRPVDSHSGNGTSRDEIVVEGLPTIEIIPEPVLATEASFNDRLEGQATDSPNPMTSHLEEEFETQYELALAYKEMGLLDEAIETFEQSVNGASRFLDSCTMIAMCYKDRRLNRAAIKWLERALRHPQCEGMLALYVKHTLAQLYEAEGLTEHAAELYASIPGMREAAERLVKGAGAAEKSVSKQPEKSRRISSR